MGELHLAVTGEDTFQKLCVVKQILSHLAFPEVIQRFVDEARVVVKLSHGNLVPVLESGSVEGRYFLAMEYVEGKNLRALWNDLEELGRRLPLNLALYLVKELCRGLAYVHGYGELGLVHRDVSPPNVLVSYTGEVKLADFGLASSAIKVQKTSPGVLVGKLAYMAPEHARGEEVDARADIFSVGILLWELITGERLYPATDHQAEQLEHVMHPRFVPPSTINTELPPRLDLIARRALAPEPEHRYQDAESMRGEVATALAELDPTTDASTMQRLLEELYSEAIQQQRRQQQQLLEEMGPKVVQLLRPDVVARPDEPEGRPLTLQGVAALEGAQAEEPGDEPLEPGEVLDNKYRIVTLLGEGGMGRVYRALHLGIHREVALKLLMPALSQMSDVVRRFRREARTASRIGHPNIVEILDSGTTSAGQEYFAMEYLEGIDLANVLAEERRLPLLRVLRIGAQICDAMAAAHEAGVIHRDLKPENIFLVPKEDSPDFVKLVDWGIAKFASEEEDLTLSGLVMGTPEYMSPEQAEAKAYDHRVDIYALGVMLYEMLTGRYPHSGETFGEIRVSKASEEVAPPSSRCPDEVPPEVDRLILSMLRVNPDQRPQAMGQVAYELRKLYKGRAAAVASMLNISGAVPSVGLPPPEDPTRETAQLQALQQDKPPGGRRTLFLALGVVAVVVAGALVAVLVARAPDASTAASAVKQAPLSRAADDARVMRVDTGQVSSLQREVPRATKKKKRRRRKRRPKKPARLEGTMDPFKRKR
jgi:serine/threonine-protein kinase